MHALSTEYRDTEWHRKRDGVELPQTTPEAILRLGGENPWAHWGGIRLSNDRTYYILPNGKPVLKSTVGRVLGRAETEHRLLVSYLTIPNGQVKNFLNACRGSIAVGEVAYVAVVGSKASEGGGIWHRYYALWLAMRCRHVMIDFYDYNEIPGSWNTEISGTRISCEWLSKGMDTKSLETMGYNVIIDDVWTYETGPGLQEPPRSRHYSRKFADSRGGARPYLHATECRLFSDPPQSEKISGCSCLVCTEIKQCARTYDEYVYLRDMCSRLGHSAPCVGISFIQELNYVHALRSKLLTTGEYEINSSAEFRRIMALTEELAISVRGNYVRLVEGTPDYQAYSRFRVNAGQFEQRVYPWLQGKSVLFCGVPASIVGSTEIRPVRGPQSPDLCDVVFFGSIAAWKMQFAARVVYVPANPVAVAKEIPDWSHTGRVIQNYYEYVREERITEVERSKSPGQYFKEIQYPALQMFPVVDTSYLDQPLEEFSREFLQGKLYSLVKERWRMVVYPFSMKWWRQSIIVRGGRWTLVRLHVERLYSLVGNEDRAGFREAACPLPWDMSEMEVQFVERKFPDQMVLRAFFLQGKSFIGRVPKQKEFDVELSRSEPVLRRLENAHPVSLQGWKRDEWQKLRSSWSQLGNFEALESLEG